MAARRVFLAYLQKDAGQKAERLNKLKGESMTKTIVYEGKTTDTQKMPCLYFDENVKKWVLRYSGRNRSMLGQFYVGTGLDNIEEAREEAARIIVSYGI